MSIRYKQYDIRNTMRGFTLAEMLLLVALIALLASVGGGIYAGTYKKMLVKKSARDFLRAAKYARMTAIERQRPCRMELDAVGGEFALINYELNEETGRAERVIVRDLYFKSPASFEGDVAFEGIAITPIDSEAAPAEQETAIVFSPNGTAQSAIIQIGDGQNHYTVSIYAASGRAKIFEGTAEEVTIGTIDLDEEW
jgi:type II secretory pathway pseudopilin PulG